MIASTSPACVTHTHCTHDRPVTNHPHSRTSVSISVVFFALDRSVPSVEVVKARQSFRSGCHCLIHNGIYLTLSLTLTITLTLLILTIIVRVTLTLILDTVVNKAPTSQGQPKALWSFVNSVPGHFGLRQNIVFVYATRIILRRTSTLASIHNKYSQTNFTTVTHHSITTPKVPLR